MAERFAGKVVVITGASSGFGKGAACRFAEEGAYLVLVARRASAMLGRRDAGMAAKAS